MQHRNAMHLLFILLFLGPQSIFAFDEQCPTLCLCDKVWMHCVNNNWTEDDLKNKSTFFIPLNLPHLNLSKNSIARLENGFIALTLIRKLFLSENHIKYVDAGAFRFLHELKVLDLSNNYIDYLPKQVFTPLKNLEKLKLAKNKLRTLDSLAFKDVPPLKNLDLSNNPWHCDCNLLWIKEYPGKLQPPPKCLTPERSLELKRLNLECPGLLVIPANDQIVFAGDSLSLRCESVGGAERVRWVRGDVDVAQYTEIEVNERTMGKHGIADSWLHIQHLEEQHSGDWICRQVPGSNFTARVTVLVLSESTKYCPDIISRNNKGLYFWPRTIVGRTVELPCAGEETGLVGGQVSHVCNEQGQWERLNTSTCPYISETTRILEQFARDDTNSLENVFIRAKRLHNLTSSVRTLGDPMDLIFISYTLEAYVSFLSSSRDLPSLLIDIVSNMLKCPKELLFKAQAEGRACTRMLAVLESIASSSPAIQAHGTLLAVEEFAITPDSFTGMSCIWRKIPGSNRKHFHCGTNGLAILGVPGREVEAAVELPASLFYGFDQDKHQLVVTMFENGNLFPELRNNTDMEASSSIIGANIVGAGLMYLNDSVSIMAKVRPGIASTPARWDSELHSGGGGWTTQGCHSSHFKRDLMVFHCDRLGYYALLQDRNYPYLGIKSKWSLTALYSGSCVLIFCLAVAIATYALCHSAVQMSGRAKHAVVNTWLSVSLLCCIFSFGVFATDDVLFCEISGLALHYFSLCTLLWMAVVGNHMYKRLSRGANDRTQDDLPPGVPLQKPILGLYLVGYGIGLIICGISGAVHLREYAQPAYCFLGAGPALSAVLVPTAILVTLLCIFYFLSLCAIRNNDVNGQLSEGTQGTEHVDLELLDEGAPCTERRSARSVATDSEDIEDTEHSPVIQLKAHVIVLLLFLLLWGCAALATTSAIHPIVPWQELIFSGLFCLFAFCLGAFILYFYCVARSDVRARWGAWRQLIGKKRICCRSRSVSDTHASLPLQAQTAVPATVFTNGPSSVISGVTGRSSSSHRTKAVTELNNCDRSDSLASHSKPSNSVNLVAMHRQLYRSNNSMPTYHEIVGHDSVDAFYNPRQSIVAKKFFKKQRKNKRNELGLRRRGDGGGTSDGESIQPCRTWRPSAESAVFLSSDMENNSEKLSANIFGYGSKINNTNIHVGSSSHRKECISPKDPNVMSDGDDDKGGGKMLLSRLVIGAEEDAAGPSVGLDRVDEEELAGPAPDCRSVELQCSLGDSSDVQDCDDSFSQKIDNLRLQSDHSFSESLSSPPQYVTVLDPKYGVVKVTMSDYQRQSDTLSLAYSVDGRGSLPSTPEELDDLTEAVDEPHLHKKSPHPCSPSEEAALLSNGRRSHTHSPDSVSRIPSGSSLGDRPLRRHHNYVSRKKRDKSRSLPSSPESRTYDPSYVQRLSLPSSPESHPITDLNLSSSSSQQRRESPKLVLPPPPDSPVPFCDDAPEDIEGGGEDQWERPSPPLSPLTYSSSRRPPISPLEFSPSRFGQSNSAMGSPCSSPLRYSPSMHDHQLSPSTSPQQLVPSSFSSPQSSSSNRLEQSPVQSISPEQSMSGRSSQRRRPMSDYFPGGRETPTRRTNSLTRSPDCVSDSVERKKETSV